MQVLLRNTTSRLYYAGQNTWTLDPLDALDFGQIDHALRSALERRLAAQVVLNYLSPPCQLALPVLAEWLSDESMFAGTRREKNQPGRRIESTPV